MANEDPIIQPDSDEKIFTGKTPKLTQEEKRALQSKKDDSPDEKNKKQWKKSTKRRGSWGKL